VAKDVTLLIKLNDQASGKLSKITNSTKRLEKAANGAQNSIRRTNKGIRDTGKAADKASKGVNNLGKAIRGLAAGFGVFQAGKFVIFKTAELERQTKSLEVLTGSLGNARNIITELQQFGAVTPFTSGELIETAKRLKAFGFQTEEVVDVTKRLADVAGATGADLGGIATAFGQIQAKGRLQGEELLQLQERGVSLQDELQKMYGLTADEFRKALEGGRISADAVNLALQNITETGGKYANGAIAQSDTLAGKFSTLVDGIERIAQKIGEKLSPALKGVLTLAINVVDNINRAFAAASITDRQKQLFKQEAEQEVMRFAGPMPGGPFGAGEVVVRHLGKTYKGSASSVVSQITNDLINREVQRRVEGARGPVVTAPTIQTVPTLLSGRGGGGGKGTEETGLTGMAKALAEAGSASVFGNIQDQLDAQAAAGKAIADALNEADRNAEKLGQTSDKVKTAFDGIAQTIEQGITGAIMGAIDGSKSLGESLSGILRQLAGQFISAGVGSFGGGGLLGALFPKRANGGTVQGGRSYMVGERGPELFTPGRTGSIAPNSAISGNMNVVVNVDASGTEVQGNQGNADQLGRLIGQAVQAELIKQKRPGGLLTR
jgi:tape measure domain-containing protein